MEAPLPPDPSLPAVAPGRPISRLADWLPPVVAGFVTVLIGFSSSVAIVFQAARAAGADSAVIGSWILAFCLGLAVTCIGLSWRYRMPIVTAWSTPGAAVLATSLAGVGLDQATGAFLFCGLLITLAGVTGAFERVIGRIPVPLAAALLAGVLTRFALDAVLAARTQPWLVGAMFASYLLARLWLARYAVPIMLVVGLVLAAALGLVDGSGLSLVPATPHLTWPTFSWPVLIGVGIPLFVVTMASQNVPGVAVLRASGYAPPISAVTTATGVATLLLAPFGAFALNLAAITAAICAGPHAHPDPGRRWIAGVFAGLFYLVVGLFGASVAMLLSALPAELVVALAGIALLATIATGLSQACGDAAWREAAVVAFLVTLSGVSFFSIGSAFWGLVAGAVTAWLRPRR